MAPSLRILVLAGLTSAAAAHANSPHQTLPVTQPWTSTSLLDLTEQASLTGVYGSSVAWGDYDNDGDLDILLAGRNAGSTPVARVYRNDGGGAFVEIATSLTGVRESSVAWGDYDNDGDLDILLTGDTGSTPVAKVYRNDGAARSWRSPPR